jgi:hypothetical protein
MAAGKPSEADYTAAMQRHGTDQWTEQDRVTAQRFLEQEEAAEDRAEKVTEPDKGSGRKPR